MEILVVARRFGPLGEQVVFVGGMIRGLLVTDPAAGPARPTLDVDCIVNVASYARYADLAEQLRALGFQEDTTEDAPICRWRIEGVPVDIMPIKDDVFGFSNAWYASGFEHAWRLEIPGGGIRVMDAVHFCATKIEAFLGRGKGDFYHHDIEDLVAVVGERETLLDELAQAPSAVREFIVGQVGRWLSNESFLQSLPGHLMPDAGSQARLPRLVKRFEAIGAMK
jgi:predicted nucleotidyltransferase